MGPNTKAVVLMLAALLALSCRDIMKKAPPPQAEVEALLKQRAEQEKREAEADVNPNLGVKVTWTVKSVEVRPQPGNDAQPYVGNVRFVIESQTPELDGVATERLERNYGYVWNVETSAWTPQ
ncbi:MAG: hypothetical protein ACRD21_08535 [Vicinamibacteria bacterium]